MKLQHIRASLEYPAVLYTGDNLQEVIDFTGKHEKFDEYFESFEAYEKFVRQDGNRFKLINDIGPDEYALPGDYVCKSLNKNFVLSSNAVQKHYRVIQE